MIKRLRIILALTLTLAVAGVAASPAGAAAAPRALTDCEYVSTGKFCGWDPSSPSAVAPIVEMGSGLIGQCLELTSTQDNRISYAWNRSTGTVRAYFSDGCAGSTAYISVGPNGTLDADNGGSWNNDIESIKWVS